MITLWLCGVVMGGGVVALAYEAAAGRVACPRWFVRFAASIGLMLAGGALAGVWL